MHGFVRPHLGGGGLLLSLLNKTSLEHTNAVYRFQTPHVQGVALRDARGQHANIFLFDRHTPINVICVVYNAVDETTAKDFLGSFRFTPGDAQDDASLSL